ncbi:MAG: 4,5-DOPA dioxygenase extradiol [Synergistaceae bacterium]|jgi:4,5-DOPA dioxygenase extradiol|nr:4,5-DOPA dioxygenase extradiol [Synergistaceae bacterium]MCK9558292.1 4,5-DOPA dioxygenase extradiol [Candidatus Cloacimonadota bacterium]
MTKMPVVFVGHGSPMNAIEDNIYSRTWRKMAELIPKPEVILSVSAHWYTKGTKIMNEENPKTIYDMYGFPSELYEVIYNSPGSPEMAEASKALISRETNYDNSWGIDHGTWSVLVHMYPDRDIPVFQISIDAGAPPETHYKIGREIRSLREHGVLIFGTGNIVHNLRLADWSKAGEGFDWAYEFDGFVHESIMKKDHDKILKYQDQGNLAKLAVPIQDHFYPLLYALGASDEDDKISVYNRSCELGSLTMTSYIWG